MDSWVSSQSAFPVLFFIIFLVSVQVPVSFCTYNWYASCSNRLNCGDITNVGYPFWGDERPDGCGNPKLKLTCKKNIPTIEMMQMKYRVLGFNKNSQTLRIAREDYFSGICSPEFVNTTLDSELFDYSGGYMNITLSYGCPSVSVIPILNSCTIKGLTTTGVSIQLGASGPGLCAKSVVVPVLQAPDGDFTTNGSIIEEAIKEGFNVKWKEDTAACGVCTASQGVCGYDLFTNQTTCYCPDQSKKSPCPPSATPKDPKAPPSKPGNSNGVSLGVGIGIGGAGIMGIFLGWWIFSIRQRRKKRAQESKSKDLLAPPPGKGTSITSSNFSRSTPSYPSSKVDLEKGSTYFGAHIFSYEELEEATNNFDRSKQLGDGGFGSVYYGLLRDGREVAVKRLYENNVKRVEQFMNEVEILSGLRHQNLVTLYGCTTKRSQELILVYEYICNGTVADHLNGTRSSSSLMTWPIRLSIALESADALAYLHASKCIHRDVKTNNILLDEHFRVKVADFGLSRLFPTNVTHVSTAPQGTPGYVDPEYYQCYQLTDKSDVYSFGVVMIELISSLPAVDTNRHRHDINLANMAINKIQNHALHELVDPSLGFESDQYTKRTVTSVAELAFRCLQQERDMRPRMEEVVEVLRGIMNEEIGAQKAEVVDIAADDIGLLKNIPPPLSPDSLVNEKWPEVLRRTA